MFVCLRPFCAPGRGRTGRLIAGAAMALSCLGVATTPAFASGVVGNGNPSSCTESALDAALTGGGEVTFQCGLGPTTITVTSAFPISADTTINGGNRIAISGGGKTRIFDVQSEHSLALENLTIQDGFVPDSAGGAVLNAGALILSNAVFLSNAADGGGAIYSSGSSSSVSVTNSTFNGNTAETTSGRSDGGAIESGSGAVTIANSSFTNNLGYDGGAIRSDPASQMTVTASTLSGNTADNSGGGIDNSGTLSITDSTFSDNSSNGSAAGGGGLSTDGTEATMSSTTFRNNTTLGDGGGFKTGGGTVMVTNATLENDAAGNLGGGIENQNTTLSVTHSLISGNRATDGAGINSSNALTVAESTVSGNQASADGGGIYFDAYGERATITDSTISGNSAKDSGGAYSVAAGSIVSLDSTISGNSAQRGGAAFAGANLAFSNSTIAGNTASFAGGALYNSAQFDIDLFSTIVANNNGPGGSENCSGPIISLGYNLDGDGTCALDQKGDQSRVDPRLGSLQDNGGPTFTMALPFGSPAVDRGAPRTPAEPTFGFTCLPTDQRGITRPQGSACDVGAYELVPPILSHHVFVPFVANNSSFSSVADGFSPSARVLGGR